MSWVCGTYGREERSTQGFWWGDLKERGHLEDLGVYGRIILKWISKKDRGHELDLSGLGEDRWQSLVNAVMNF